jgi:hypothetical protein
MPYNAPCKTVEIRVTGSVQLQYYRGVDNWLRIDVPSSDSSEGNQLYTLDEPPTGHVIPIGEFLQSKQRQAESEHRVLPQPVPPSQACPENCPCTGRETSYTLAPIYTNWQEIEAKGGSPGIGTYRFRFRIRREMILTEGLCLEPTPPPPDDFEESQYGAFFGPPGDIGEVALALRRLTDTLVRIESVLTRHDAQISKLEKS